MPRSPSTTTAERPRRGCLGCFATSGLGCAAFLFGAVAAVVLLAPSLLAEPIGRWLVADWSEAIAGRVRLESLDLAWTRPVRLLGLQLEDPDGALVGAVDVTLPSLRWFLLDEERAMDVSMKVRSLDLVLDGDGGSNLVRALRPAASRSGGWELHWKLGSFDSRAGFDQRLPYRAEVAGSSLRVFGPGRGEPLLAATALAGKLEGGGGALPVLVLGAELPGALGPEEAGRLDLELRGFERPELSLAYDGLPTALVDLVARAEGRLGEALGVRHGASWTLAPEEGQAGSALDVSLQGANGTRLDLRARVAGGKVEVREEDGLAGELELPLAWFDEASARRMPEGLVWKSTAQGARWSARSRDLALDLSAGARAWRGALAGSVRLESPSPLVLETAAGEVLASLELPSLALEWAPGAGPAVELVDRGAPAGTRRLSWKPAQGELALELAGASARLIEAALAIPDVARLAGERLDLAFRRDPDGTERVSLARDGRSMLAARIEGDHLVAEGEEEGIELAGEAALDLAGDLLPWFEALAKPAGEGPAVLRARDFAVPLERGLGSLRAHVELDLGTVEATPCASFRALFPGEALPPGPGVLTLGTLAVDIEREIASYGGLELVVGEDEYHAFEGTYDLRLGALDLRGELPLRWLGRRASELERDIEVPVNIKGRPDDLRILLDNRTLEEMSAGLEGLLERLRSKGQ